VEHSVLGRLPTAAMTKKISKRALKWGIALAAVAALVVIGLRYWKTKQAALPEGIASGNGRLEGKLVDVAAKEPLRVKEVVVDEGALVKPGQVLVRLDTITLEAELTAANASVAAAQEHLAFAEASIVKQKSEINLAAVEVNRSGKLVEEGAGSQRELDVRRTKLETTNAALAEAQAMLQTAKEQVEVAQANAATIKTRIDDATLRSPVTGRVLYRLAEAGEVLAPGGKALTLVNMDDVYMEIFLPAKQAASVKIGAEGRITVDYDPIHAVAGHVSFVSPEAQFTPKQVETLSEREKLMFRVKIQLPREVANQYLERVKTGVRGVGYVKVKESAAWPARLQNLLAPETADTMGE
jgi:HlyD family secretion protein